MQLVTRPPFLREQNPKGLQPRRGFVLLAEAPCHLHAVDSQPPFVVSPYPLPPRMDRNVLLQNIRTTAQQFKTGPPDGRGEGKDAGSFNIGIQL